MGVLLISRRKINSGNSVYFKILLFVVGWYSYLRVLINLHSQSATCVRMLDKFFLGGIVILLHLIHWLLLVKIIQWVFIMYGISLANGSTQFNFISLYFQCSLICSWNTTSPTIKSSVWYSAFFLSHHPKRL